MKGLALILSLMAFVSFNSFSQDTGARELLSKQDTKTEIFNTILNDYQLMTEFMEAMHGNEHARMMMKGRNPMMGHRMVMSDTDSAAYAVLPHMTVWHPEISPWCIR